MNPNRKSDAAFDDVAETWWMPGGILNQLEDFNPLRMSYFRRVAGPLKGRSVLDIGCGGGLLSEALHEDGASVCGVDVSGASIREAQRHARCRELAIDYRIADAAALPFPNASFDIIVASEVLEHVADVDTMLDEVARVLKPGGIFLFDTPNRTWISRFLLICIGEYLLKRIPKGTHDGRRFIRHEELKQKLRDRDIATQNIQGFFYRGRDKTGHHQFRFSRTLSFAYFGYGIRASSSGGKREVILSS